MVRSVENGSPGRKCRFLYHSNRNGSPGRKCRFLYHSNRNGSLGRICRFFYHSNRNGSLGRICRFPIPCMPSGMHPPAGRISDGMRFYNPISILPSDNPIRDFLYRIAYFLPEKKKHNKIGDFIWKIIIIYELIKMLDLILYVLSALPYHQ